MRNHNGAGLNIVVLLTMLLNPSPVRGQEDNSFVCGTEEDYGTSAKAGSACVGAPVFPSLTTPVAGTLRALIVFVRFQGDSDVEGQRNWPVSLVTPPSFSAGLLSTSTNPTSFPTSSLTKYFYDQSQGNLTLYGEIYDDIIVPVQSESYYRTNGWGYLTRDVLDVIDQDPTFSFADFDANNDGFVDYIFIVVRRDSFRTSDQLKWVGVSDLRGGPGRIGSPSLCLQYDGKKIHWQRSGSYLINHTAGNVDANTYYVRLLAHEFGHDLFLNTILNGGHLPSNPDNDVPMNETFVSTFCGSKKQARMGYALMIGNLGLCSPIKDVGGHQIFSTYERNLLGWISCSTFGSSNVLGATIKDAYMTLILRTV
jgi:hypothetical protein